jgi:tetratricopeptide (TPR) repeat protein
MIFTPSGPLQIKIGLNSGHAQPINNDYTASAVDKAARVESKCEPGRVYLSRETHELIRDKVRGVSTTSAGSHDLKGVAEEELFVAFAEGSHYYVPATPVAAPAKVSLSTSIPNNLPSLQPFFGREKELKTIREALDPESRTWGALIDGPGGMGKTSLAVRAAYDCEPGQFQRIIFVSVKDREMDDDGERTLGNLLVPGFLEMLNEIARELGQVDFAKAPEDQRIRLLLDALRPWHALLILDNLESIPKSDRHQLFNFVKRLPQGCKAILTSRRRIGSGSELVQLDILDQDAALATLAELAEHNKLLAKISEAERLTLWKQTGGNPLLLRWVAGQLGRGSCRTFTDALHFLGTCPEGNDPLEFIFGDLADEFTPEEESVLVALTYFTLPAKVEHIASVAGLGEEPIGTALNTLANRSLVVPDQEETQYALVPMVADFLRKHRPEVVRETGDRLEQRAYALIVENGYKNHDRFPVLDAAWPTVAPALPLFLAGPNARLQTVCDALLQFLEFTGRWDERLSLFQQAEARAVASGDPQNAGWRAYQAGYIHYVRQEADAVLAYAERAAVHWRAAKPGSRERAVAIELRGHGHRLKRDYLAAITAYREVLDLDRRLSPESPDVAIDLNALASAEKSSGDFAGAERDYREALRVARVVGFAEGVANYTGNLAALAVHWKDWPGAETLAREAVPLSEKVGRQELIAHACLHLAKALVHQGKASEALPHARRAVEIYTKLGLPHLSEARAILAECEE